MEMDNADIQNNAFKLEYIFKPNKICILEVEGLLKGEGQSEKEEQVSFDDDEEKEQVFFFDDEENKYCSMIKKKTYSFIMKKNKYLLMMKKIKK